MDGNYKKTTWKNTFLNSFGFQQICEPSCPQARLYLLHCIVSKVSWHHMTKPLPSLPTPCCISQKYWVFFFPFSSVFLTYLINSFIVTQREEAFYCSHHWHWPGSWFIIYDTREKHAHTNLYSWSSHLYSPNRYDTIHLTYPGSSRALSFGNIFFSIVRKKNSIWEEKNIPIKLKQIIQGRMKEEGIAKQCVSSQA